MWVFGGRGTFSAGFLNEHGDFTGCFTNQLLCYDPCSNTWTNPKYFGNAPSPRARHATAIISNTVFLYGGLNGKHMYLGDFFMMNMNSLFWTIINTNQPNLGPRCALILTAMTDSQLFLHGGYTQTQIFSDMWIFNVENGVWSQYTLFKGSTRYRTGIRGLTSSVFIIGGRYMTFEKRYTPTFHFMLEPKSLQQLAMYIIYQHKDVLPLELLPSKLINQLLGPAEDEDL